MATIITQIEQLEKEVTQCKKRIEEINGSLREKTTTADDRNKLKEEAEHTRTEMISKEKQLTHLRRENRNTTLFAILVVLLAILIYSFAKSTSKTPTYTQ